MRPGVQSFGHSSGKPTRAGEDHASGCSPAGWPAVPPYPVSPIGGEIFIKVGGCVFGNFVTSAVAEIGASAGWPRTTCWFRIMGQAVQIPAGVLLATMAFPAWTSAGPTPQ